jgi:hypothetical protein
VKLLTLLRLIGSGTLLLSVGAAIFTIGIGFALVEATALPASVCFGGLGLLMAIAGFVLFDRGSEEAEEQVKKMPSVIATFRNPFFGMGMAIFGGILLQRLLRRRTPIVVEKVKVVGVPMPETSPSAARSTERAASPAPGGFSIGRLLHEGAQALLATAGATAADTMLRSVTSSLQGFVDDLLKPSESTDNPAGSDEASPPADPEVMDDESPRYPAAQHNPYVQPSHNHNGESLQI